MTGRMAVLRAAAARHEAHLARVEAEIRELAGWYVEDGLSDRSARQKAVRNHPYYVLRRWREAHKLGKLRKLTGGREMKARDA